MSIVRADGWVAWYVETPPDSFEAEDGTAVPRQRMISVPLVVWRELLNGGVMGMVTREASDFETSLHILLPAPDLVITGPVNERTGSVRRYLFSHYGAAPTE